MLSRAVKMHKLHMPHLRRADTSSISTERYIYTVSCC